LVAIRGAGLPAPADQTLAGHPDGIEKTSVQP
jgi:hypothetical protein